MILLGSIGEYIGRIYDEVKQKYSVALTPTAGTSLDKYAVLLNISRSELVEQIARNLDLQAGKLVLKESATTTSYLVSSL